MILIFRDPSLNQIISITSLLVRPFLDGSAVGPSEATQGMVIPPHASAAFRHFVPVYKKWLSIRIAD